MLLAGIVFLLISFCGRASPATVIPRPTLDIGEVSPYTITVVWTLPKNELFSEFVVEMVPEEGDKLDYEPIDMKRTFVNLTPGTLYTFIVRTVREEQFSDEAVIVQDTIPLPPTDLELRYFDTLVLTMEGPYFQDTSFTVEAPGVEANWKDPISGKSDCFYSTIEPDDGYQAIPGHKGEVVKDETMRQFIHLVPGKEYTVTVHSSTCGEGHRGIIRSDGISASIKLPPADPPAVVAEEITTTTAELVWDEEPIEGFYSDFEVVQVGDIVSDIVVETPSSPTQLGRSLSKLTPCAKYDLDVYTLFEDRRSTKAKNIVVNTMPYKPLNLTVIDFTETTMTLAWDNPDTNIINEFSIEVAPSLIKPIKTEGRSIILEGLLPGVEYKVSVRSMCDNTDGTMSVPSLITQTTKPLPPPSSESECSYIGDEPDFIAAAAVYDNVPWEAPEPSKINLTWTKPSRGSWDGFLVHYSPYEFEQGLSSPASPIFFGPNTITTQVTIPVSGRVVTASIRTVSRNVASEPLVKRVVCGDRSNEAVLKCRSMLLYWNIRITPIDDNTNLLVEIPNYPIHNATINMDDLKEVLVFYNNTFVIRNPCDKGPTSKITVYPNCPSFLPFCPVIVRRLCVHHRGDYREHVTPDACCNSKLYNTNDEICCHNKLLKKYERSKEECCVSKWYNRQTHSCCTDPVTGTDDVLRGTC